MRATDASLDVVGLYSRVAAIYDAWTWFTETKSLHAALERARIRDGEAVLEVAVGTGIAFREILKRNPSGRNVGIDLTASMLRRARQKAERIGVPHELLVADARSLSFEDKSFDVVVNNNMLGLLPQADLAPILSEMSRVLRPGGRLVIVTMMRPATRFADWIYRVGAEWLGGWRAVDIEPLVGDAGFESVSREVVMQLGIPSEVLIARKAGSSPGCNFTG